MSFKTKSTLLVSAFVLASVSACGLKTKNPMEPYKNLQVVSDPELNGVSTDKVQYVVIENNKNVLTQVSESDPRATDGAGQVALQNGVYQILGTENLGFIEGKEKSFEFSLKFLQGKVKADIDETELVKAGFKVERLSQDVNLSKYRATYTAAAGSIPQDKKSISETVKISLKDLQYVSTEEENAKTKKTVDALILKTTDISYVIRRDDKVPTLVVNGLDKNIKVGTVVKFTVDITAPSNYTDSTPLTSEVFFDVHNIVNSQGLVEANGAYFVSIDPEHNKIEKIANNKWRMHYIFDAKDTQLLPQFDKNLRVVENADKLYVSLSFRVSSDKVAVSDKKTVRFYIGLN